MSTTLKCEGCGIGPCTVNVNKDGYTLKHCLFTNHGERELVKWEKVIDKSKPEQDNMVYNVSYFDNPNCPPWANYIAINKDGDVWIYEDKPEVTKTSVRFVAASVNYKHIGSYNLSDLSTWQNSIIERPKKVEYKNPDQDGQFYDISYFNNKNCPKWGNYIVMDKDGTIWVYQDKPMIDETQWKRNQNGSKLITCLGCYRLPDTSNWKNSLIERPKKIEDNKPKRDGKYYDASYFNNPECPPWANYIVMNEDGNIWIYEDKPILRETYWRVKPNGSKLLHVIGTYCLSDTSAWRNSIIERPKQIETENNKPPQDRQFYDVSYFENSNCPSWANYIAMNPDGIIWIYEEKPLICDGAFRSQNQHFNPFYKKYRFDKIGRYRGVTTKDWKNSIIERPKNKVENKKPEQDRNYYDASYFNNPECPSWANYIVMNEDGNIWIYEEKPIVVGSIFRLPPHNYGCYKNTGLYKKTDKSAWKNSIIERPKEHKKPKQDTQLYNVDYFNNSECPTWGNYIAMDKDGSIWIYEDKPRMLNDQFASIDCDTSYYKKLGVYNLTDISGWKNSIIERPTRNSSEDSTSSVNNSPKDDILYFSIKVNNKF